MIAIRPDDSAAPPDVWLYCLRNLDKVEGLNLLTVRKPSHRGRGVLSIYKQQLSALKSIKDRYAFNVENDVLYHPDRFDFVPPKDDVFYYQTNLYELTPFGYLKHSGMAYSQVVANCGFWRNHLISRLEAVESDWKLAFAEPGRGDPPDSKVKWEGYKTQYPDVGVRHGRNCSGSRDPGRAGRTIDMYVAEIPYWGHYTKLLKAMGIEQAV